MDHCAMALQQSAQCQDLLLEDLAFQTGPQNASRWRTEAAQASQHLLVGMSCGQSS